MAVDFVLVYGNTTLTNISSFSQDLLCYSHEEADNGMVLHALDVSRNNLFTEMVVSCSDSDVLLLLLNYFENLSYCITLKTSHHKHDLQKKR